jgi:putative chitinase
MKVTRQQMLAILGDGQRVDYFLHYINAWAETFEINTPLRFAHFLAQCCHETAGFKMTRETCLKGKNSYFNKYEQGKLGKMLGNTQKGDGAKFRGRGLLMLTGRANYTAYMNSGFCKGNIISNPELLEQPLGATKSGMWYWWKHGLNAVADKDDVVAVTKKINGGTNGLESRKKWLATCKKALGL